MGDFVLDSRASCRNCRTKARKTWVDPEKRIFDEELFKKNWVAPRLVVDHSMGELTCTGCGLVLEDRMVDESEEWRQFAQEGVSMGAHESERRRVDKADNGDFHNPNDISTGIAGASNAAVSLQQAQLSATSGARAEMAPEVLSAERKSQKIKNLVDKVREHAGRLSLGQSIIRRCQALLEELDKRGKLDSQKWHAYSLNALIHLASSQERATRTITELAQANAKAAGKTTPAAFEKSIERKVKDLSRDLGLETTSFVEDEELMQRYVRELGLAREICKPASHIAKTFMLWAQNGTLEGSPAWLRRRGMQASVVASAILIVAALGIPRDLDFVDVANVARVTEEQVRTSYKKMFDHVRRLLPQDFACKNERGVSGLRRPT